MPFRLINRSASGWPSRLRGAAVRYLLVAIFAVAFVAVAAWEAAVSFPCLAYPTAYFKTVELGTKIDAFHAKHGRMPSPASTADTEELHLEPGYTFVHWVRDDSYTLGVPADVEPKVAEQFPLPFRMGFDGPWVVYNATRKTVSCGHR